MATPFDLDEALKALTGRMAAEYRQQARVTRAVFEEVAKGVATSQTRNPEIARYRSSLFLPQASGPVPVDYIGVYVTLSQYAGGGHLGLSKDEVAEAVIRIFTSQAPRWKLVELLVTLNRGLPYPELADACLDVHRQGLEPRVAERFDNVLKSEGMVPAAPQTVLAALRHVLGMPDVPLDPKYPPENLVLLFVHAIADGLAAAVSDDEERVAGLPITLAMEMVCNAIFNEHGDTYSAIARQLRLWRDYADEGARHTDGRNPADLARQATGLDVEDFLALGFAFMAHTTEWRPGSQLYIQNDYLPKVDRALLDRFLDLVATTPEAMRVALRSPRSHWDFLEFQRHPVLRMPAGLLVIDADLLFERVTSGLYWDVHDYLKRIEGENSRNAWTKAWGAIVEAMIEEELTAFAPRLLGGSSLVWDEDDVERAFGANSKRADQVIDVGEALVVTDVVSGQLSVPSRIDGDLEAFRKDLKRLVFDKAEQVHETAVHLIEDESKLTGVSVGRVRPIYPIIAVGSSFARNPIVTTMIDNQVKDRDLLSHADPLIKPLSVIDMGEVEMLEGLAALRI